MSKAILVMDMPESCMGCNFMYCDVENNMESCQAMEVSKLVELEKEDKPDWCPLSPMPEWLKELKALRTWKNDVMEDFCKVDCSSVGEVYQCGGRRGYNKAIDDFLERVKEVYAFTILEEEQIDEIAKQLKAGDVD